MSTDNMVIAKTILDQLGGRRFVAMTGAKNFVALDSGLGFKLPGGGGFCKRGINHVRIILDPSDTYTVTFNKIRKYDLTQISAFSDIYFDQIQELFTRETGLDTHL